MKEQLLIRFRSIQKGSLSGQFLQIQQTSSAEEYRNLFVNWLPLYRIFRRKFWKKLLLEGCYQEVEFCRLVRFSQMMQYAQMVENREILRKEANLPRYNRGKFPYYPYVHTKSNATNNYQKNRGNVVFSIRTITLRGSTTNENKKERPSKRLSDVEFQAKREKGLCFKCDEKYCSGHKCKAKEIRELRMFVIRADNVEEEIIEEDVYEQRELCTMELKSEIEGVVELCINSVVGLTNPGAMKVRGKIQGREVIVLIDCGATHNFISDKLVLMLKLNTKDTSNYGVIFGSGTAIKGRGICEKVEVDLDG